MRDAAEEPKLQAYPKAKEDATKEPEPQACPKASERQKGAATQGTEVEEPGATLQRSFAQKK